MRGLSFIRLSMENRSATAEILRRPIASSGPLPGATRELRHPIELRGL